MPLLQFDPAFLLVPALPILGTVLVLWIVRTTSRNTLARLSALAEAMRLQLVTKPPVFGIFHQTPELAGEEQGRAVRLFQFTKGSGKNSTTWWALTLTSPQVARRLSFSLQPQNFGTSVRAFFGAKEIQVGDADFDRRWFIETNAPDFLPVALIDEVRAVIDAAQPKGVFRLADGTLRYEERGALGGHRGAGELLAIKEAAHRLASIAEVFERR